MWYLNYFNITKLRRDCPHDIHPQGHAADECHVGNYVTQTVAAKDNTKPYRITQEFYKI